MSVRPRSRRLDAVPVTLLMASIMLAFVLQHRLSLITGAAFCALYVLKVYSRRALTKDNVLIIAGACLVLLPAFLKPSHGFSPVFYSLATIAVFITAAETSKKPPLLLLKAFQWLYWGFAALIFLVLYRFWGHPEPFGMLIEGSSTNGIPAYLIVLQISLSLITYLAYGKLPIGSVLVTCVVAFYGVGRGSIVIAVLLAAATFTLNLFVINRRRYGWRLMAWGAVVVLMVGGVFRGADLVEFVTVHTKLSVGLLDTNRLEILEQYWGKIDAASLFFGADYSGTVIDKVYGGNPHIGFIRTHSFFGLPFTLLAVLSPVLILLARKRLSDKIVFFTFVSLGVLRSVSEPLFFPTLLDLFYFQWIWIYLRHASSRSRAPACNHKTWA